MKDHTYGYSNVKTGYSCTRNHPVDVRATAIFKKGIYQSSTIVYKKSVPLGLVLGLTNLYKGFHDVPNHWTGLTSVYQHIDNDLVHPSEPESVYFDTEVRHAN